MRKNEFREKIGRPQIDHLLWRFLPDAEQKNTAPNRTFVRRFLLDGRPGESGFALNAEKN